MSNNDYADLVKWLRDERHQHSVMAGSCMLSAADAIETLVAERDEAAAKLQQRLRGRKKMSEADEAKMASLREALERVTQAYDKNSPMRTADFHDPGCDCMRCAIDNARATLEGK